MAISVEFFTHICYYLSKIIERGYILWVFQTFSMLQNLKKKTKS